MPPVLDPERDGSGGAGFDAIHLAPPPYAVVLRYLVGALSDHRPSRHTVSNILALQAFPHAYAEGPKLALALLGREGDQT
jgi:hypothetical protein